MEKQRLLKLIKEETDIDAIGMILSNYTDYGHNELGGMVSVNRFPIVAEVILEWIENKKAIGMNEKEILAKIDEWHYSDSELPLYEYLGMTKEEYVYFVTEQIKPR